MENMENMENTNNEFAVEVDYIAIIKELKAKCKSMLDEQTAYTNVAAEIANLSKYSDYLIPRVHELSFTEQFWLMKLSLPLYRYHKEVCEKYGWDEEIDDEI